MDILQLSPFPSVAASATSRLSTSELRGRSVHGLVFELGGTFTRAHIDNVKIRAGGKDLIEGITGARLESINVYNGHATNAAYMTHWFGDPLAATVAGRHLGDLDLSVYGENPIEIEIEIGAATSPTLNVYAIVGAPKRQMGIPGLDAAEGIVRALHRTILTPSAAVTRQAQSIGMGSSAGARLRALQMFHTNMTKVEFRKAGDIKHDDLTIAANAYIVNAFSDRVAQSGLYSLDRIMDGVNGEAETTVQADGTPWAFQVRVTTSASDTITTFADVHTAIPLI